MVAPAPQAPAPSAYELGPASAVAAVGGGGVGGAAPPPVDASASPIAPVMATAPRPPVGAGERGTVGASVTLPDWTIVAGLVVVAGGAYLMLRRRGHV